MLTLFAMPKPFRGHIGTIQRNAIGSWARLRPPCQILLFGNEEGTGEVANEFGAHHVPDVACNEYGTPLVNDLFERAQRLADYELLCYVNCDVILMDDFMRALQKVSGLKKRFLMVGACWNLGFAEHLRFDETNWQEWLRSLVREKGEPRGPDGIDYFALSRGLYERLPPFALGRAGFDNWLIWKARSVKAAVVDATNAVMAIHQNHDYSHVAGGRNWSYWGEEARRNIELAGGLRHCYLTWDANYRLGPRGLKRNLGGYFRLKFRWINSVGRWWWWILDLTFPLRQSLGLRMSTLKRLKAYLFR